MSDWLADDPLGGREVWGVPSAGQCFTGDCYAAWCEPEQCRRAEAAEEASPPSEELGATGTDWRRDEP